MFEGELPGLLRCRFGDDGARRVMQPTLSIHGGDSVARWRRFGGARRWMLVCPPHAEAGVQPGMTHLPQTQDPRPTGEALVAFWGRHPVSAG